MPRRFFKRISPRYKDIKDAWYLRPFRTLVHDPSLWATHRKAVVPAVALGLFVAFIPLPIHPLLAVAGAIIIAVEINGLIGPGAATQKPLTTVSGTIHGGLALWLVLYVVGALLNS